MIKTKTVGMMRALDPGSKKFILKIFDRKTSAEKRPHTCSVCGIYKREIEKGNKEALEFYKEHIADVAARNNGVTVVLYSKTKIKALAGSGMSDCEPCRTKRSA